MQLVELLKQPWPWYVAGPLIGLIVPILLIAGGKMFGVSANLRHACAACVPADIEFFKYDWKGTGKWNLVFILGTIIGGFISGWLLANPEPIELSAQTVGELKDLGVSNFSGMLPSDVFNWENVASTQGIIMMVIGGFFVGFGARYAGGCTSGHAISGLADLQLGSLLAVIGFFAGGLFITYVVYPFIF